MTNILKTYPRSNLTFINGEGSYLIEENGDKYLDFGSGIAVNSLGYSHPVLNNTLTEQARKLWHVSNVYNIPEQEVLAKKLCELSFADYVFFCNSGTESIEAAIKIARRYFYFTESSVTKNKIITFTGSFHGRTLGALAAGGPSKLEGFNTSIDGFINLPFGDHQALEDAIDQDVAAILVEPIQGEGGVSVIPEHCLESLRKICDEKNILLIFDEVQCGIGRSGDFFAFEKSKVKPDIVPIAKGIGGGFPIGAVLMNKKVASGMTAGTHGSTFGGNPLAMAVGNSVMDIISDKKFLNNIKSNSKYFLSNLNDIKDKYPKVIKEIRGRGFLIGIQLNTDQIKFIKRLMDNKLLTIRAAENVVRILPPLNVKKSEIDQALKIIKKVCLEMN